MELIDNIYRLLGDSFKDVLRSKSKVKIFDQIWNDSDKVEDVTDRLCEHIASVYQENSPERIYFLILYNIFNEFLDDINEDVLPNDKTGVKTKVLMLSATPVNNRFLDLRNQLALAYEGDPESLSSKLKSERDIDEIFRRAQAAFNSWSKLLPEERTAESILKSLDFDFFELLDTVTIARSRRHIEAFYDTANELALPDRALLNNYVTNVIFACNFFDLFGTKSLAIDTVQL